jgi:hypothetical protein
MSGLFSFPLDLRKISEGIDSQRRISYIMVVGDAAIASGGSDAPTRRRTGAPAFCREPDKAKSFDFAVWTRAEGRLYLSRKA